MADGNHLLPLLLEGFGDSEAAKKYCGPLAALADAPPSVTCPGAADRFLLRVFAVHLLVWAGSVELVMGIKAAELRLLWSPFSCPSVETPFEALWDVAFLSTCL